MPDDVSDAIERFQTFLGQWNGGVIDEASGFTVSDGMLLVGEVELSYANRATGDNSID